jgi:diguanylate cyclase (GGDEF) domain
VEIIDDRFNLLLSQSKRTSSKIAALFIDLDGFKKINDEHGHNAGDILLIEISNRLKKSVRDSDTIARWGGDEFIILLNNIDGVDGINILINRIIEDCSKPVSLDKNLNVSISLSIGVSMYPENGNNKTQLLELADKAMYVAKKDDSIDYYYSK